MRDKLFMHFLVYWFAPALIKSDLFCQTPKCMGPHLPSTAFLLELLSEKYHVCSLDSKILKSFPAGKTKTPFIRRVTLTPDPDTFEKYRDTPPIFYRDTFAKVCPPLGRK